MRTAIDTNAISAFLSREPAAQDIRRMLVKAKQAGGLVISGAVYAELLAYPNADRAFMDNFLMSTGIQTDFDIRADVWIKAGEAFSSYAERRREHKAGHPKRILADFLIGAHALLEADRLLTLDKHLYQTSFPKLKLIASSQNL
ncbi:MAG: PIN domain-containing protein [Deinococcota bacterium]